MSDRTNQTQSTPAQDCRQASVERSSLASSEQLVRPLTESEQAASVRQVMMLSRQERFQLMFGNTASER